MHRWGDKGIDWKGIDDCCTILWDTARRWGRLGGQIKEKFGTVRFYANFGRLSLHTLLLPGYFHSGWFPNWLWNLDQRAIGPAMQWALEKPFVWWQKKVYNYAYQKCMKKHPHLRAELLCGADYPELIKGATRTEGNKKHILGWDGEVLATWETN